LYFRAYARLYSNDGAMTPDDTGETVDGMSREKISTMIDLIRHERWRWTPVKRVYIPKRNGKLRPLGLPICLSYCLSFQAMFGIPMVANGWARSPSPPSLFYSTTFCRGFPLRRRFQCRCVGLRSCAMMSGVSVIQRGPWG